MLTLGETRITHTMTCGCSLLQMPTFFMLTYPGSWRVYSSLKMRQSPNVSLISNCSIMSSKNAFHLISSSVSCCTSWRRYSLNWSLFLNTFHSIGCVAISSLLAGTADLHQLLMNVINSFHASILLASAFTFTYYTLHLKTSYTSPWLGQL
jgi:hypothetical protein